MYSLEIDTQRVWDYAGDGYVHRLIQSNSGGKLVELPSASNMAASMPERLWNARYPGNTNSQDADVSNSVDDGSVRASQLEDVEVLRDKMEALGAEYSSLIISQLDSQRVYYETQIAQVSAESVSQSEHAKVCKERDELLQKCTSMQEEMNLLTRELSTTRSTVSKQETQLRRALETMRTTRHELDEEKSVSNGLYSHVQKLQAEQDSLQNQVAELTDQLRDVMFFVSAREKVEQSNDALGVAGGDVIVPPPTSKSRTKKKGSGRT